MEDNALVRAYKQMTDASERQSLTSAYEALIEAIEEFDISPEMRTNLAWFEETIPPHDGIPAQGNLVMVYRGSPETIKLLKQFIESVINPN